MSTLPLTIDEILPDLPALWSESLGNAAVCVAVLDGPVDVEHPCFSGSSLTKLATLASEPTGNGRALAHGTHIASIIFGQHTGTIKGLAPACRGLIVPIYSELANGEPVPCSQLDLARAISLAVRAGADIINISGGQLSQTGSAHPLLADSIRSCLQAGVLIVAAAGNEGCDCVQIPAALPAVLAVGAMDADGTPLSFSNWGPAYRKQGVLAPGRNIPGAEPGGEISHASGTSYAAAIVSGAAAVLMSAYLKQRGTKPSGHQVREAILSSVTPCTAATSDDCRQVLAGRIELRRAFATLLDQGDFNMSGTQVLDADSQTSDVSLHVPCDSTPTVITDVVCSAAAIARNSPDRTAASAPLGLLPADAAGGCKCGGSASAAPQLELVYALGELGVDFLTEARRDSLAQAMGPVRDEQGRVVAPYGNPQDLRQLLQYLNNHPWDAAAVTWTLNIDATPVYAIVPAGPYAAATHERLREFLKDMQEGVERISVPGLTAGSVRLANGQSVPAIIPDLRGMYSWTTGALVESLLPARPEATSEAESERYSATVAEVSAGVRNFLERIYFELRNLGQTPQERAINYAATNAFNIEAVFENAHKQKMDLDTIDVEASPICRPESDCWDVKLMFFYPEREAQAARRVYRFTVDVSDVVPVTVGPMRTWMMR